MRRSAKRVRISVQLVDANTGGSLWAERYDRDLDDIFALQDEIADQVAGAIEPELDEKNLMLQPPDDELHWRRAANLSPRQRRAKSFRSSRDRKIRRQHGERRCDDQIVMAASRLQAEPASLARLEDELSKLVAQEIAAGRTARRPSERRSALAHWRPRPDDDLV